MPDRPKKTCEDCLHHEICLCYIADKQVDGFNDPDKCAYFRPKRNYIEIRFCDDPDWEVPL